MHNDEEFYYKSSFYKRDLIVNSMVKKFMLEMIDQYRDLDVDTKIVITDEIDHEMVALSAVKDP